MAFVDKGGMGEVYRALDPRLRREVALKIVDPELAAEPGYLDRLRREARTTGSLRHPNIVVVFDVGVENGLPYVVSEFLEGESLRQRLDHGRLPYRKALDYGIQIAQGLGAAHARGVWHRDIKPANTFVTTDGQVKILDFGLATQAEPEVSSGSDETTEEESTTTGTIRGTAGYMAPEQARGERIDHRADIFALGAVLYEMFTGARAFQRRTKWMTLNAVVREDPTDPLEINPTLPPAAATTVRRCLEKNPDERFQSARDLAFHLQQLRDASQSLRPTASRQRWRRSAALAVVGIGTLAVAVMLGSRMRVAPPPPIFDQLTFQRGQVTGARFAAEGQAVVYSHAARADDREVWRIDLPEGPRSHSLGYAADVLASRKGELALSIDRRFVGGKHFVGRLVRADIAPRGAIREMAPDAEDADWDPSDPSGMRLAMVFSTGTGGESRLEYPAGRVLYRARSIRHPRFSPEGRRIAFLEDRTSVGLGGRVGMVDLEGRFAPLTEDYRSARGLAWSAEGDEVWFSAGSWWGDRALRAVDLRGHERVVLSTPSSLTVWDIASDGRVLFTRDEDTRGIVGVPPGESTERDVSYYDNAALASLSADGRLLLFTDRFGTYLRSTADASPPMALGLTEGFVDDLSRDGTKVLATLAAPSRLAIVPVGAGDRRELPSHGIASYSGALWFPNGNRILFNGARPGEHTRAYLQDTDGGPPRPVTPPKTRVLALSPDGEWAAGNGPDVENGPDEPKAGIWLWPVVGGPPRVVPRSQREDRPVAWSADGRWLWVFRRDEVPARVFRLEIATGRRELTRMLMPPDAAGVESIPMFRTTPSGNAYFYSYRRVLSKLYLARNLR